MRIPVVHPLSIRPASLPPIASSSPVDLRHLRLTVYRCSLPGLTGFAASHRAGPGYHHNLSKAVLTDPGPRAGIRPRYSGLRVQGTASSPSSTTSAILSRPITPLSRRILVWQTVRDIEVSVRHSRNHPPWPSLRGTPPVGGAAAEPSHVNMWTTAAGSRIPRHLRQPQNPKRCPTPARVRRCCSYGQT